VILAHREQLNGPSPAMLADRRRREVAHYHRMALDLAEQCEHVAAVIPWPGTASKVRQAASSLRWQIQWESKHPAQAFAPHADKAERAATTPEPAEEKVVTLMQALEKSVAAAKAERDRLRAATKNGSPAEGT
jgi:hypothetical protein